VFLGGRVNKFVTGAAPLSVHILEFFWALNLQIYEVYGMSEATGITHCNTDREWRLGSVGKALPGVETMIAADGEILVRLRESLQLLPYCHRYWYQSLFPSPLCVGLMSVDIFWILQERRSDTRNIPRKMAVYR